MNRTINVIKIGGNVIDNPEALAAFVERFAKIPGDKVLIHGGGKEATRMSARLGIETQMIEGRRVTDRATLDIVTMVYAGLVNKRIVAMLQANGCNAIGLSGADGNAIKAVRRPAQPIDYGFVGDIDPADVNDKLIGSLLDNGLTPVFCAITHDGDGNLLNCNADTVASFVAIACSRLGNTSLTFCFEKAGVLADIDDESSVIRSITSECYAQLKKDGIVSGGMIPKVDNAFKAIARGVDKVIIKSSDDILSDAGTCISL